MIADTTITEIVTPLINIGVAGVIIWWFMNRTEVRLKAVEERLEKAGREIRKATDRSTRAILLLTTTIDKDQKMLADEIANETQEPPENGDHETKP